MIISVGGWAARRTDGPRLRAWLSCPHPQTRWNPLGAAIVGRAMTRDNTHRQSSSRGERPRGRIEGLFAAALEGDQTSEEELRRLVPLDDLAGSALEALLVVVGSRHIRANEHRRAPAMTLAQLAAHDQMMAAVMDRVREDRTDVHLPERDSQRSRQAEQRFR